MRHRLGIVILVVGLALSLAACVKKEPPAEPVPEPEAATVPAAAGGAAVESEPSGELDVLEADLDGVDKQFKAQSSKTPPACPDLCGLLGQVCKTSGKICVYSNQHAGSKRAGELCGRSRTLCLDDQSKALALCGPCPEGS